VVLDTEGARSAAMARIMADCLEEIVEPVASPQNAGAMAAALLCGAGLGAVGSFREARQLVPIQGSFEPDPMRSRICRERFEVFRSLYQRNRESFRRLNGGLNGGDEHESAAPKRRR
jgi:xylulokinase